MAGPTYQLLTNTGVQEYDLITANPDHLPKIWNHAAAIENFLTNCLSQYAKASEDAPYVLSTELSKGAGTTSIDRVAIQTEKIGGTGLSDNGASPDDFNFLDFYANQTQIGRFEDIITYDIETGEVIGLRDILGSNQKKALLNISARRKEQEMAQRILRDPIIGENNYRYPNGKMNKDQLTSSDALSWEFVTRVTGEFNSNGGRGAKLIKGTNLAALEYLVSDLQLSDLRNDIGYQTALKHAQPRSRQNPFFTGEVQDVEGNIITPFRFNTHENYAPIGNPFDQRALLGVGITPGDTAFFVRGGGNPKAAGISKVQYFRYFDNFAYLFFGRDGAQQQVVTDTSEHYIAVVAPQSAGGKIGIFAYVVNDGEKLTITKRLSATSGTINSTVVGDMVYGSGPWTADVVGDTFPPGSMIYQVNSKGQPFQRTPVFGANAVRSKTGMWNNHFFPRNLKGSNPELINYNHMGTSLVIGQSGLARGYRIIVTAINVEGGRYPIIV
ncbi:MAG: hypothetical protein LBT53_04490 [Puniceicoccales bacterium]|jgi:hypothetical protein|nr:hypothetical protein [Puniceicoccales bacterium]